MIRYFKNYNWPENLEILLMLILGILLQMIDGSPFSMKDRWSLVWDIELPAEYFSMIAQKIIKMIITMIIMVRCSTTYAYVVSAMLVIFCLLKKTTPKLMLLWLFVAGVKSICMTFIEALAGVYVCSAFGKIRKACIEFFISKAMEIIFAAYLWGNVLSIYQDMESKAKEEVNISAKDVPFSNFSRRRARSLLDESTLYKTACLNNFDFKDVPQIILQMLKRDDEMSQDSLLGPGMMLASVSNLGSFDNLKTSQSLGELGFTDLKTTQVVGLEEDENLSHRDKVLKFLKLTRSDVARIKLNKSTVESDIYAVDDGIWARVIASGTHINKPKQARTEVFIRKISQPEESVPKTKNQNKLNVKVDFTFSNLLNGKQCEIQDDQEEEDSLIFSQDEEEGKEDEEIFRLFMSNIKEGTVINRYGLGFGLKTMKGNQYEQLYKQDFMSEIGSEVFERATKLPKVTSFTKAVRNSMSLPEIKELLQTGRKNNVSQEDSIGKIDQTSSSVLPLKDPNHSKKQIFPVESFYGERTEKSVENASTGDEIMFDSFSQVELEETKSEITKQLEDEGVNRKIDDDACGNDELLKIKDKSYLSSTNSNTTNPENDKETKPCFRKRRILIKRKGKRKPDQTETLSFDSWCSPRGSSGSSDQEIGSNVQFPRKDAENLQQSSMMLSNQENNSVKSYNAIDKNLSNVITKNQVYFRTEILKNPHWKVLITYCDLSKKTQSQGKVELWSQESNLSFLNSQFNQYQNKYDKMLGSLEAVPKEEKTWKSNVLKTVETCFIPKYSNTLGSSLRNASVFKELLKTEYLQILDRRESFSKKDKTLPSGSNGEYYRQLLTSSIRSTSSNNVKDFDDINVEVENETCLNFEIDSEIPDIFALTNNKREDPEENSNSSTSEKHPDETYVDFASKKSSRLVITSDKDSQSSEARILKNDASEGMETGEESGVNEMETKKKLNSPITPKALTVDESICSQESDEPISLCYSKAADLASPLLDMKRFIYPDHIHYSYKHVNKKGFNVDINGGFPLLVRENVPEGTSLNMVNESTSKSPELEIKRRPMDLSFATTDAFADWQNNYSNDAETRQSQAVENTFSTQKSSESPNVDFIKNVKTKKVKYFKKINERKESRISSGVMRPKSYGKNFNDITFMYSAKDYILIEKLLRMHVQFNKNEYCEFESGIRRREPVRISSSQLHSNKGRKNPIKNPAIFLQKNKNKTRNEKKKIETQEERTKDMFTRLAREAFLQNSNAYTSHGS